MKHTCFTCVKK